MRGLDDLKPWAEFDFSNLGGRPLYWYVGAGLSTAAGLVGWNDMASAIERFRSEYEGPRASASPPNTALANSRYLQEFIEQTGDDEELILSRESKDPRVFGRTVLLNLLLRLQAPKGGSSRLAMEVRRADFPDLSLHSLIWQTRCHGVFTTNYDMLLEEAFLQQRLRDRKQVFGHMGPLRSYRYTADFLRFLMSNPRFVLKLHGDVNDIGTMVFDPSSAWNAGRLGDEHKRGDDLSRAYAAALGLGHMIYVGSGLRDRTFKELHRSWRDRATAVDQLRIALIPRWEQGTIREELGKDGVRSVTDITFLTYGADSPPKPRRISQEQKKETRAFLRAVVAAVQSDPAHFGGRAPCPEGQDIWGQLLRRRQGQMTKSWSTVEWTAGGREI